MEKQNNVLDSKYLYDFALGSSRRLNNLVRYNTRHRTTVENVASHSFYVTLYSLIIADMLMAKGQKLNVQQVLVRALIHDMEECVAGDVLKHVKDDEDMNRAYDKIANMSIDSVLSVLPEGLISMLKKEWENVKDDSIESWVVNIADNIGGIVYCHEQCTMGNKYFEHIYQDYISRLNRLVDNTILQDIYTVLVSKEMFGNFVSYEKEK
jgi:5'-deoxynucleotidase YfbR-like HD superfamily hydrolase